MNYNDTEGHYLLLTSKHKLTDAKYFFDDLIKNIHSNSDLKAQLSIDGEPILHANYVKTSAPPSLFNGYTEFLILNSPKFLAWLIQTLL